MKIQIPESTQRFQEKLLLEQLLFFGRRRRDSGSMTVTKTQRLKRNETKHSGQLKCAEGNQCGSSHPYRVLSLWRSNHHDLHRERSRRRQFLVMRSPVPWHMAVPPDDTTVAYQSLQKSTSRFTWKEMPWISLAPLTVNFGWSKTSAKRTRSVRQCWFYRWEEIKPSPCLFPRSL